MCWWKNLSPLLRNWLCAILHWDRQLAAFGWSSWGMAGVGVGRRQEVVTFCSCIEYRYHSGWERFKWRCTMYSSVLLCHMHWQLTHARQGMRSAHDDNTNGDWLTNHDHVLWNCGTELNMSHQVSGVSCQSSCSLRSLSYFRPQSSVHSRFTLGNQHSLKFEVWSLMVDDPMTHWQW